MKMMRRRNGLPKENEMLRPNDAVRENGLSSKKLVPKIFGAFSILMLAVFLPVLFCVVIIGNHMDYNDGMKLTVRIPNQLLFLIALIGVFFCMFLFRKWGGIKLSRRVNWAVNGVLALLFLGLYFVNVWLARQIAFHLPWDIMIARGVAYEIANERPLGYYYYLSIYPNNIPIGYILGRLYRKAMELKDYPYIYDFIWIQANCVFISLAGFLSCLTVKKLTQKPAPVAVVFGAYLVLAGISPWKIAPYTDTYGLIFPIMCVYFYLCYREARQGWRGYLWILLSITAGMAGGFVKPNLYLVVIALLGTEILCFFKGDKKRWGYLLAEILLTVILAAGSKIYTNHLIEEIGLEYNEEISAGWQHYFLMGLNEAATGSYNSEDVAMFGEFQNSRSERIEAELERAAERMKSRGFFGSIYFYLRKMVMTFNDGVFGWKTEVWMDEPYPEEIADNTPLTQRLRSIFWGDETQYDVGGYNTLCQLVWIFCILGIPGICLCTGGEKEKYGVLVICFLGIFFYQMLFEARARYLFVFLPLILAMAVCGIQQYAHWAAVLLRKRRAVRGGKT